MKRAPCFFSVCIPGLTEEFKMSVFFHTSSRVSGQFGLRLVIVTEEASATLMDRFEALADNVFMQLNLESTIERIDNLEKQMYTRQKLKEIQHMVVCLRQLDQYTGINCMNPYSKELMKGSQDSLSKFAKSYLKCVC